MQKREALPVPEARSLDELIGELEPVAGDSNADTLLVSFAGARLGLGVSRVAFRRCLDGLPVRAVMTPDVSPWWWSDDGILAGAPDGTPSPSARARLQARWPHRHLICEGTSLGATVAVMAGSLFGAELVLAFAPVSFYDHWRRWRHRDRRWPGAASLRRAGAMKRIRCDLRKTTTNPGYGELRIVVDRLDRLDSLHTRRIARDPRTRVLWQRGGGHGVLRAMYLQGTLRRLFVDALAACGDSGGDPG